MKKILIGIPSTREDQKFIDSLFNFVQQCEGKYIVDTMVIKDQKLSVAQNYIAERFCESNFDYLLFLDDDHYGHNIEMLDCLIAADAMVTTMKTYSRHYPYVCSLYRRIKGRDNESCYAGIEKVETNEGYLECDLTGFPMTLIKRELFFILNPPFFKERKESMTEWATDREFFERLATLGIKPIGCFQYCLDHQDVTQDNVLELREKGRHEGNNEAFYILQKQREKQLQESLNDSNR